MLQKYFFYSRLYVTCSIEPNKWGGADRIHQLEIPHREEAIYKHS